MNNAFKIGTIANDNDNANIANYMIMIINIYANIVFS